ncbi:unnamed protein product [Blepharisma stoltei]|uniref:DUF3447 domain-containing protein n=1 Tax=Blepharisma stoltei TaxID=1481888 RepID=A0AAU9JQ93_9CILI|nr:unnamed protein product [Blepharisma stoltei]
MMRRDSESNIACKIRWALCGGNVEFLEGIMKRYPKVETLKFIEKYIDSFYEAGVNARNIESISFLIENIPINLLIKAIEKDDYFVLKRFINVLYPNTSTQEIREIRKEILIKLSELDENLKNVIYSNASMILNN